MTWPITTWSTWSGATSARSSAAVMAAAPRSVASTEDSPPPSLPIGVRAVPRMTVLGMRFSVSGVGSGTAWGGNGNEYVDHLASRAMRVTATTEAAASTAADTVVVGLVAGEGVPHDVGAGVLQALVDAGEAKTSAGSLAVTHAEGKRWILVGL